MHNRFIGSQEPQTKTDFEMKTKQQLTAQQIREMFKVGDKIVITVHNGNPERVEFDAKEVTVTNIDETDDRFPIEVGGAYVSDWSFNIVRVLFHI